ncbi:phage major capsid protein [Atopobium fossor]|uniref:phage major capsid protein n=1 Tax=Atopobium fossor TaxID=39487 RepID=UPI0003F88E6D|nr:phage major capsid protein [Atopobium fossor]
MPINLNGTSKKLVEQFSAALKSEDKNDFERAFDALRAGILEDVTEQYNQAVASNDAAVLAQRGFRQLTSDETKYYQRIIDALSSSNPRQELANFSAVPDKMMPSTIFDEIIKDIQAKHPLLARLNMVNVGFITEWLRNKHTKQLAAWGNVGEAITKEITSAFEVIDVKQGKLSAFALVSIDMLKLGPVWMDGYVRTVLGEAIACGLEAGVVAGKGAKGEPVGLNRDIHEGVSYSTSTGYPEKSKTKVTEFTPATYGGLVAQLAKDEKGKDKSIDFRSGGVALVCTTTDYLTKVMPATTVQLPTTGQYVHDLFPVPTEVFTTTELTDGTAILFLPDEYDVFVGGNRGIEYSDEAKFIEDQRAFKSVMYAYGRAFDNTSAIVLDISKLDPAYLNVTVKGTVNTKTSA